jgi:hypothetical protein
LVQLVELSNPIHLVELNLSKQEKAEHA